MKRFDLEKMHTLKRWLYNQLTILFKNSVKVIEEETKSSANTQVPMVAFPETFLTYVEHQKMNVSWAEMEKYKAEATQQLMRERIRYA